MMLRNSWLLQNDTFSKTKLDPDNVSNFEISFSKTFLSIAKSKIANGLKRVLPKFRADPTFAEQRRKQGADNSRRSSLDKGAHNDRRTWTLSTFRIPHLM